MKKLLLQTSGLSIFFTLLISSILFVTFSPAQAEGLFIPATSRTDMVFDDARKHVYITNGGSLLKYNLSTGTFLTPFDLGGSLAGIDISPDGNTLVVANRTRSITHTWIYLIDLETNQVNQVTFPRASREGGTFSVAFGADGTVFITSTFEGSGWVPLRHYDPTTETTTTLASVRQNSMLTASGDRQTIGYEESNTSSGSWGYINVSTKQFTNPGGTSHSNYEIGVNHDGTQFALPTYFGTLIHDTGGAGIPSVGQYAGAHPIGVAYHPTQDVVYFAWAKTSEVRAHNTSDMSLIESFDAEYTFSHPGNHAFKNGRLKISKDGNLIFVTVDGGVRIIQVDGIDPLLATITPTPTNTPLPSNTPTSTETATPTLTATPINTTTASIDFGLIMHYPLNGNLTDMSGYGRHATSNASLNWEDNLIVNLSEVTDYIKTPVKLSTLIKTGDPIHLSLWFKASPHTSSQIILGGDPGGGPDFAAVINSDGYLITRLYGGVSALSDITVDDYKWHQISWGTDGTDTYFYLDGNMQTTAPSIGVYNRDNITLGGRPAGPNPSSFYNGLIDEVRIYDRALTQNEISQLASKIPSEDIFNCPQDDSTIVFCDDFNDGSFDDTWSVDWSHPENPTGNPNIEQLSLPEVLCSNDDCYLEGATIFDTDSTKNTALIYTGNPNGSLIGSWQFDSQLMNEFDSANMLILGGLSYTI